MFCHHCLASCVGLCHTHCLSLPLLSVSFSLSLSLFSTESSCHDPLPSITQYCDRLDSTFTSLLQTTCSFFPLRFLSILELFFFSLLPSFLFIFIALSFFLLFLLFLTLNFHCSSFSCSLSFFITFQFSFVWYAILHPLCLSVGWSITVYFLVAFYATLELAVSVGPSAHQLPLYVSCILLAAHAHLSATRLPCILPGF